MGKKLSEMSLEELWKLFPISLTQHKDSWKEDYAEMERKIRQRLSPFDVVRVSHIGSTAIEGIQAKNIVDILVEVSSLEILEEVAKEIEKMGFLQMSSSKNRYSFNLGYTENGFADKVYHLHLRYEGDHDELYFRDYLREHIECAKEYEQLKLDLWKKFEFNRDAYTEAKTEFIKKYTKLARENYANRYEDKQNR